MGTPASGGEAMAQADQILAAATEQTPPAHTGPVAGALSLRPVPAAEPSRQEGSSGGGGGASTSHGSCAGPTMDRGASRREPEGQRDFAGFFRSSAVRSLRAAALAAGAADSGDEGIGTLGTIPTTVVAVTANEHFEDVEPANADATLPMGCTASSRRELVQPRTLVAVRVEYPDPAIWELMEILIDRDTWTAASGQSSLPGPIDSHISRSRPDVVERNLGRIRCQSSSTRSSTAAPDGAVSPATCGGSYMLKRPSAPMATATCWRTSRFRHQVPVRPVGPGSARVLSFAHAFPRAPRRHARPSCRPWSPHRCSA